MSIQGIEGPSKTRSATAQPQVQGPDDTSEGSGTDAELKRKLEKILPEMEQMMAVLMRALGMKEPGAGGGADEGGGGGDCPASGSGGGGGSPSGAGGGGSPKGAGGGGGSPKGAGSGGSPKGAGGGEGAKGGGTEPSSKAAGDKAGTSQADGKGGATVDVNGDGKADVHVSGPNADKYAANVKKYADESSEFKNLVLKDAQQNKGVLEINRTQGLGGPSGTAAEGTGSVNIAPEPDGKLSKHVLTHEMLHNMHMTHHQHADSAAIRAETNRIVGPGEDDNLINVLDNGTKEMPDGSTK